MTRQEAWVAFAAAAMGSSMGRQLTPEERNLLASKGAGGLQRHVTNGCAEWADAMVEHMLRRWPESSGEEGGRDGF